jgi:hypothetical protein
LSERWKAEQSVFDVALNESRLNRSLNKEIHS